tara:strand:- start:172 stop:324 length:153 start_codon:yes stop_codon:yes gene_type:complete
MLKVFINFKQNSSGFVEYMLSPSGCLIFTGKVINTFINIHIQKEVVAVYL